MKNSSFLLEDYARGKTHCCIFWHISQWHISDAWHISDGQPMTRGPSFTALEAKTIGPKDLLKNGPRMPHHRPKDSVCNCFLVISAAGIFHFCYVPIS